MDNPLLIPPGTTLLWQRDLSSLQGKTQTEEPLVTRKPQGHFPARICKEEAQVSTVPRSEPYNCF